MQEEGCLYIDNLKSNQFSLELKKELYDRMVEYFYQQVKGNWKRLHLGTVDFMLDHFIYMSPLTVDVLKYVLGQQGDKDQ